MQPVPTHVDYVTTTPDAPIRAIEFVVGVLSDPFNAGLFAFGGLGAIAVLSAGLYLRPRVPDFAVLAGVLESYRDLVPWMLRLSVGLPTLGAGFAGYYFSPVVSIEAVSNSLAAFYPGFLDALVAPPVVRLALVGVGFAFLLGFVTRAAAVVGFAMWISVVILQPGLLLALEYPFAFIAIGLLGGGRPSADEMFAQIAAAPDTYYNDVDPIRGLADRVQAALGPYRQYASTVVRVGLGLGFIYLGIVEKLLTPARALLVVEKYNLTAVVPVDPGVWVLGAALTEIGVGALLLVGLLTRGTAMLAFVVLTTTLFGLPDDPVLAHVSLFGLTSAVLTLGAGPLSLDDRLGAVIIRKGTAAPTD